MPLPTLRARECVPATRARVRALLISPSRKTRGMARRKAQIHLARIPCGDARRLSARHRGVCSIAGPRFRRKCPASPSGPKCDGKAFGIDLTVVSQLLAGTPSGPGRSPGAARVPGLRSQTRRRRTGQASGLANTGHRGSWHDLLGTKMRGTSAPRFVPPLRRLAKRPLGGRGRSRIDAVLRAGIIFCAVLWCFCPSFVIAGLDPAIQ
jgi:hypothetical protein